LVASRLDVIVASHRDRASSDTRRISRVMDEASRVPDPPSLLDGLVRLHGEPLRVLAEVKRRSPSVGDLSIGLDAAQLAADYERGGAAAVSVLTDGPHFAGSEDDLRAVRAAVSLPVLRKDFTVSELDVADARLMGASGVLLIVAALSRAELRAFLEVADALGIDALVEVHDHRELEVALAAGALLVGVNQRDLATFEVDRTKAATLAAEIPSDVVAVAESGIADPAAAQACAALGYDAVLVGEALVRAPDPAALIAQLRGAPPVAP
jgi:indole-3-glycerol phosphate synthase